MPAPKAPDATDYQDREIEMYYDGSWQATVFNRIWRRGHGTEMVLADGTRMQEYKTQMGRLDDGYPQFDSDINTLKSWGAEEIATITGVNLPVPIVRFLLHDTPMVRDLITKVNTGGFTDKAKEFSHLMQQYQTNPGKNKGVRFAAQVQKPNGDIIWWPIHGNVIGICVD